MLAMFSMYGTEYNLENMQQVYELHPASTLLPLLATREINKLEEQYFTPLLAKERGGRQQYVSFLQWRLEEDTATKKREEKAIVTKTARFFEKMMADKNVATRSLYGAGAAYLYFVAKDYGAAKAMLAKAKDLQPDKKINDQLQLITLLIAANEGSSITREREAQLLPSMKWLVQKAEQDEEYKVFCRNFFSEIMAQKYEQQNNLPRAAFAYAMADLAFLQSTESVYFYAPAINFVQEEISTEDLMSLFGVMTNPATETENFFVQNASVKKDDVTDVLGTSYLRDRNYPKAIEWLSKTTKHEPLTEDHYNYQTGKSVVINIDPFYDYLNDWQRFDKSLPSPYTKLSLAKKLQEMKTKLESGKAAEDRSKLYYQYASALYNMSFYGNSWNAVAYYRSTVDWNKGSYKLPWEKEYFGVYEARVFYQKAYDAATEKEFKAACLFMVAKCAQKQIPRPAYDYNNYEQYEKAEEVFFQKFKNNPLFARFKSEFGATRFYQYTYNRCSYLRDYVKKQNAPTNTPPKPKSKS